MAPHLLRDDAYDYDGYSRMLIFLPTDALDAAVAIVLSALATLDIRGNRFVSGVVVAVADETHCVDLAQCRVIVPDTNETLAEMCAKA